MTHEPRKPEQENDFERDLEAVQSAWHSMEAAEPPGLLDQAVLNAARRDLEKPARKRPLQWLGGFATAAVVVVAVSLFFLQELRTPTPLPEDIQLEEAAPPMEPAAGALEKSARPPAAAIAPAREVKRRASDQAVQPVEEAASTARREKAGLSAATAAAPLSDSVSGNRAADEEREPDDALAFRQAAQDEKAVPAPETWIEDLLERLEKGQTEGLAEQLERFSEAYPEYPLPPELAEWLP